jgi:hypothetical protein
VAGHAQLAIDLDGIQAWGQALTSVRLGIDQQVAFAPGDDQLGPDPASVTVQRALTDFDTAWKQGREIIDSYMVALSKMCDDTVAKIRELDHSLAPPVVHHRQYME